MLEGTIVSLVLQRENLYRVHQKCGVNCIRLNAPLHDRIASEEWYHLERWH